MKNYNPLYDPLVDNTPGSNQNYAPTYWIASAGEPPAIEQPLDGDIEADVAIIGSGFTGLATALFLAQEHNIKAVILEANQLSWGCTSRNGGQGQLACGRLGLGQWVSRWGEKTAQALHADIYEGFERFRTLVNDPEIECDPQGDGHLYLAHRASLMRKLEQDVAIKNKVFNYPAKLLTTDELKERYVDCANTFGGLLDPEGIGVHPVKLAFGYTKKLQKLGVRTYPGSPVTSWTTKENGQHQLNTPNGIVTCQKVVVATGGYTSAALHPSLAYRYMPILSNSIVTRPLTASEKEACGFKTNLVITDSRFLRFYFRLLPDDRLQIGTRSAISGSDAANNKHYKLLFNGLVEKFPALSSIQIDYSWWGWVDVSHDMMPRIFCADGDKQSLFYSIGYGGNGVSFSVHAGARLANMVAGKGAPDLPIYTSPLPKHLFTPFRRIGQQLFYHYYHFLDTLP